MVVPALPPKPAWSGLDAPSRVAEAGGEVSASSLEALLTMQLRALGLPPPVPEHKFGGSLGRRWRFDLAFLRESVAVEIQGGTWMPVSHHGHGQGFEDDCEKMAAAVLLGWRVITLTGKQVESGIGASWIERAVRGGEVDRDMFASRPRRSPLGLRSLRARSDGRGNRRNDRGALPDSVLRAGGLL